MPKVKVCMFIGFYPLQKGGAEYQSKLIALYLKQSVDVFFISYGHDRDDVIVADGFRVYCLKRPTQIERFSLYYFSSRKIFHILKKECPDVIYQRVLNSYSYHLARISAKISCELLIHIADNYCLAFNQNFRDLVRRFFFRRLRHYHNKGLVGFITQTVAQTSLLRSYNINPIIQVYNFHPLPLEVNLNSRVRFMNRRIIWIGSVRPVKNFELFLQIVRTFAGQDVDFYMVGRFDDSAYSAKLRNEASRYHNLNCYGELENNDVNQILKDCTLLINTSYSEGFSNTFIQAWMRGIPVISFSSDPDELISKNNVGFCAQGDFASLINSIRVYLNDFGMYESTSMRCIEFSGKLFALENNISNLIDVILK